MTFQDLIKHSVSKYEKGPVTPTLSIFDEVLNAIIDRDIEPSKCEIVFTVATVYAMPWGDIQRLGRAFKTLTWRDVPGMAFAIVEAP